MIFLPKCRPFYVVLEKGHGAGKKGMVLGKRALCWAKLKLARGNTKKWPNKITGYHVGKNLLACLLYS